MGKKAKGDWKRKKKETQLFCLLRKMSNRHMFLSEVLTIDLEFKNFHTY